MREAALGKWMLLMEVRNSKRNDKRFGWCSGEDQGEWECGRETSQFLIMERGRERTLVGGGGWMGVSGREKQQVCTCRGEFRSWV